MNNETGRSCQVALDGYRGRFFESPCEPSPVSGSRTVKLSSSPLVGEGAEGMRTGAGFLESPCVPSSVSGSGTVKLSSSPLVGEEGGGDEGQKRTGMQKITHLSQEIYP